MQKSCDRVTPVTGFKIETIDKLESDTNRTQKGLQSLVQENLKIWLEPGVSMGTSISKKKEYKTIIHGAVPDQSV